MSNRQIAAMIARRNAANSKPQGNNKLLASCLDAAGFNEHRTY